MIPTPISCARYYHRTLNPEKLLEIGFSAMPVGMSKETFFARYALPKDTKLEGLRLMEDKDVPSVGKLMRRYMRRFDMSARFTDAEIAHLFLSGRGDHQQKQVTWTYVVENPQTSQVTDMFSFYSLPSSVLDSDKHKILEAGYLFYYATDVIFSHSHEGSTRLKTHTVLTEGEQEDEVGVTNWADESPETKAKLKARLNELMHDMLILAKRQNFDVLNCLTVMDNPLFLNEQRFGVGDGMLRFYLFVSKIIIIQCSSNNLDKNWRIVPIAGGMGARAGEAEMDPVVQHAKARIDADASTSAGRMSETERTRRLTAAHPRPEMGSGNGIVMV